VKNNNNNTLLLITSTLLTPQPLLSYTFLPIPSIPFTAIDPAPLRLTCWLQAAVWPGSSALELNSAAQPWSEDFQFHSGITPHMHTHKHTTVQSHVSASSGSGHSVPTHHRHRQ